MKQSGKKGKREKIKLLIQFIYKFGVKISDNYTAACAAQAAFFILLSIVPIISLILAVTTYLPFTQQDVLNLMMQIIPDDLVGYVADIIADLYARAGKTVISLSAIAMLWSASKGIAALMDGFNSMYQLRQNNSNWLISRCIAIVYTILFIILFVIAMCGYVAVSHYYQEYIKGTFEIESTVRTLLLMIRYVMGWLLISRVVVIYIDYFPNLSLMYGSLAGIVIAMLWLYFCMYSIFIGAVINYLLSEGYLTQVKKMLK